MTWIQCTRVFHTYSNMEESIHSIYSNYPFSCCILTFLVLKSMRTFSLVIWFTLHHFTCNASNLTETLSDYTLPTTDIISCFLHQARFHVQCKTELKRKARDHDLEPTDNLITDPFGTGNLAFKKYICIFFQNTTFVQVYS